MTNRDAFGELYSKRLEVGDIVEWSRWNPEEQNYDKHFGILLEIKNEFKSNRLISVSRVVPLCGTQPEIEFFTLSLRLVSKGAENNKNAINDD
jgi:hypothetical protein